MCKKFDCRKRDYHLVRSLAMRFVNMIEGNVRFFYYWFEGIKLYDFEPEYMNEHIETTIEIFRK